MSACSQAPVRSHVVKREDISTSVNGVSRFGTGRLHETVISSRSAMVDSTHAFMAGLPDGRTVMVAPAPPALPPQIIPAPFPWPAADLARPINPAEYLQ